jgi:xeroderma pigmentosum group C-complementing protein
LEQEDSSELSDVDSSEEEFEDVLTNSHEAKGKGKGKAQDEESSGEEDWEDALGVHHSKHEDEPAPVISGDIELTLSSIPNQTSFISKPDGKKGPSKVQRHIRIVTHCMHVQFLMFHNLMRNSWIQDRLVQKIVVGHLTTGCWREMDRYWRDAGISDGPEHVVQGGWKKTTAKQLESEAKWKDTGKSGVKEYAPIRKDEEAKASSSKTKGKGTQGSDRIQRDWGAASNRLEENTPNLSAGDPLLRLLKYLTAFWKSKFKATAPCLRKRGYLSPQALEAEINTWREDPSDTGTFGERIGSLEDFRELARKCQGSRDVGQQLFTALLRGLGIEARMIASLQPVGFGWSQAEEGKAKNLEKLKDKREEKAKAKIKVNDAQSSKSATPVKPARKSQAVDGTRSSPIDLSGDESSELSSVISISSDSELDRRPTKPPPKARDELPSPTYWTEVISYLTHTPICVSTLPRPTIATVSTPDTLLNFYARGAAVDKAKQVFAYIIAFSSDGTAKDVTTRYLPKHQWPGRTKGFRIPIEKIPIHDKRGKVKKREEWDWFKSVLRPYARHHLKRQPWDEIEDEGDLVPRKAEKSKDMDEEGGKETLQGYKNSAEYVLERHLRREEALKPGAEIVRHFTTGKGNNEKSEPVYRRKDIVTCKTVESWHKEGREVKEGEQPLKFVPMRAVTVTRKREIEEREREEGVKIKQGLYSHAQTDWIIPPPIENGKIPRNTFGNIDVYVETMIPKGAVHIPLKGTARICKKLGVDFAEACTGFEFGKQRAVPVLTGVVVAAENEDLVIDAWEIDQAEKAEKEQAKKEALVLSMWKKFFTGLRIVERMKREYGDEVELPKANIATVAAPNKSEYDTFKDYQGDFEGGFVRDEAMQNNQAAGGFVRNEDALRHDDEDMAGGFFPASQEEIPAHRGKLTIDHGEAAEPNREKVAVESAFRAPISLASATQKPGSDHIGVNEEYNDDKPIVPKTRNPSGAKNDVATHHNRGRGRGGKSNSTSRRKSAVTEDKAVESPLTSFSSSPSSPESEFTGNDHDDEEEFRDTNKSKRTRSVRTPTSARAAPKRKAARKSDQMVKSHFFADESDEETDKSPMKSGRGRTKGRGQGRGRGRGRGEKK